MRKVKLPQKLECLRCGYKWLPRIAEVRICPTCKSPYWDRKRRTTVGRPSKRCLSEAK